MGRSINFRNSIQKNSFCTVNITKFEFAFISFLIKEAQYIKLNLLVIIMIIMIIIIIIIIISVLLTVFSVFILRFYSCTLKSHHGITTGASYVYGSRHLVWCNLAIQMIEFQMLFKLLTFKLGCMCIINI